MLRNPSCELETTEERRDFDPITIIVGVDDAPVAVPYVVETKSYSLQSRAFMPSTCPRFVFACFKRVERWGDRLTGAAGPFFVAIATILFIIGTLCFRMLLFCF